MHANSSKGLLEYSNARKREQPASGMAAITENLSNLNVVNEDVKMHRYGVNVTGVKQVLKSKVSTLPQAEERDVKKLLEKYKDSIEKLKTKCKDILSLNGNDPGIDLIYDDIFILRYVLSKKNNLKKAEEAIRVCCKWRADPEIREQVLKPVADNTWTEAPVYQSFCKHMCFGVLGSQVDGGCLFYLRDGLGFPNTVFESLKRDEFLKIGFQSREYIYRWCDYETRRLGRLVKAMFILDMDKVKLSKLSDSRVQKCYAELGEFSENNNPQMVDKYLVVNAPSFIPWFISFVRPLFPRSMMDKFDVFPNNPALGKSQFSKKWINLDYLPDYLGGKFPSTDLPKELTGELIQRGDGGLSKIYLGRRTRKYCEVMTPSKGKINYKFALVGSDVYLTATFHKDPTQVDEDHESPDQVEIQKQLQISAENGVYSGAWEVPRSGVLIVELSNAHSRFTGRTLKWAMDFETVDT